MRSTDGSGMDTSSRTSLGRPNWTDSVVVTRSVTVTVPSPDSAVDDLADDRGRRRGARREADHRHAGQPGQVDVRRAVDEVRGRARPLGAARPAAPSWTSSPSRRRAPGRPRRRRRGRPPAGWSWRSRCRPSLARASAGTCSRSAPATSAASSIGERGLHEVGDLGRVRPRDSAGDVLGRLHEHGGRRAPRRACPRPPRGRRARSARPCSPRGRSAAPRRAPSTPAGRSRRSPTARAPRRRRAPRATRRARRTRPSRRPAPRRARRRTPRRAARGRRPPGCCARSACARRPARRACSSARSTISIARSTPAQNDRGPASSTVRSRQAAAHFSATGAALRSDRSAAIPPPTMPGPNPASDTARMTATGRSPAAPTSAADSMSAARYPSAASALRSADLTSFGTVTIVPARAGSARPAQLGREQVGAGQRHGVSRRRSPRSRRPGLPG